MLIEVAIPSERNVTQKKKAEKILTLILLTWTIWRAATSASKWRMTFNSAFKGLNTKVYV
jgi:hypothetical protein